MTQQPVRKRLTDYYVIRAGGALVLLVGGIVVLAKLGVLGQNTPRTAPATPAATAPVVTAPAVSGLSEGVYLVGTDVQPGTYRSPGANAADEYCMWSRHSTAAGGMLQDIVASDGGYGPGQMIVTVEATDALFRTAGCAPFTKVS